MCGIAGFLDARRRSPADSMAATVAGMASALRHRGPDDHGVWVDAQSGIALGHRRLSILDLSRSGHQPMVSAGARYVLSYNGEIYNFKDLRKQLLAEGEAFRGHSDTEILLAAVERWGLDRALARVNGMFAFALWDRQARTLHLARDRLGEKPLYYGWAGDVVLFGSELKALRCHPDFAATVDRAALALYLRHNCVPAPHSIYTDVFKLPPGEVLTIEAAARPLHRPRPQPYWSAREVAAAGMADPVDASGPELVDELEHLLRDAIGMRMHADVPLGSFLSGGIDSSVVVALMQAQTERRVKTFTVGFDDDAYDESRDAARVARHLGTEHVDVRLTPRDAMDVIPRLPLLYDEPFADSSQIPTFLVSRLARREVTVVLSGDGGDELFAGYNRYAWCGPIWEKTRWFPRPARRTAATVLRWLSPDTWDELFRRAAAALPPRMRVRTPGAKIRKLATVLPARNLDEMYLALVSHWKNPESVVLGASEAPSLVSDPERWLLARDPVERMMYLDQVTYLPDDILTKVDRASMGVSLEARVPMLDHRVVELAWRMPLSLKLQNGQGKWPLRQILHRHVPAHLVERPKMGFGLPIGDWLRGPLRDWAEDLLGEARLRAEGFFEPTQIRIAWDEHLTGRSDRQDEIWDVLMFQAWLEETSSQSNRLDLTG